METQEIQAYKARLEKEYIDLLSYRQGILKQAAIDERLKKGISSPAKEIFLLKERIKELETGQKSGAEEPNRKQIEEISAYKNRISSELEETLSFVKVTIEQVGIVQKELEMIKRQKGSILKDLWMETEKENKAITDLKKEKSVFVAGLASKEKVLSEKEKSLLKKENDLIAEKQNLERKLIISSKVQEKYESSLRDILEKQKEADENKSYTEYQKQQLQAEIEKIKEKIFVVDSLNKKMREQSALLENKRKELLKEENILRQKEEAVEKTREQILEEKKRIEKDRQHLYSQQSQLKSSFTEARRKGII